MSTPAFTPSLPLRTTAVQNASLPRTSPRLPVHTPRRTHRNTPCMINFANFWKNKKDTDKPKLNFEIGYSYLAHPEKNTGEDAFFVEGNTIGVFDGVSGAADTRGVDPRLYSQTLAAITRDLVRDYGPDKGPANVVKAAFAAAESNDQIGASTACVVGMDEFGRLFGINLGDGGVRIVRGAKMVFRTREQQHFFNCPYQLGTDSEDGLAMGQNVQQKLKEGDWLIVATDGLYDNIADADLVNMCMTAEDAQVLADEMGDTASAKSVDTNYRSPFMAAAEKAGVQWKGGKADDITVVAARILRDDNMTATSLLSTLPEVAEVSE